MLHAPVQARARDTLDRLLVATARLLQTQAYSDVSVAAIARAAGVTTGAIFARFADKDSLLLALDESLAASIAAEADKVLDPARWVDVPLEASLERLFRSTIDIYRQHVGVIRAVHSRRDYPPLRDRLNAANKERIRRVRWCIAAATLQSGQVVSDKAVGFALMMCVSVIREMIVFGDFSPESYFTTDHALARELARAFVAQISAAASQKKARAAPDASTAT